MADIVCARPLLRTGADLRLRRAHATYPEHYDDVFDEVHRRLIQRRAATKLDLAALIGWKHVRNAPWMKALLKLPEEIVGAATAKAFSAGLTDRERIRELEPLPGFGSGGAFTSVLLTAWDPARYGVYDRLVHDKRKLVIVDSCSCTWSDLPTYWDHLRVVALEMLPKDPDAEREWTPRMVEMAMLNLSTSHAEDQPTKRLAASE